jgi:hypothetical protein
MTTVDVVGLMALYFALTLLALWWVAIELRRWHEQDLRWHREILLKEMQTELLTQEYKLANRLRQP